MIHTCDDGRYLRDLLGVDFTDEQLAIVAAPLAPQLVVAGAGSGKTTVMAARVVHAVAHHGLAPSAVLGLTFTNKAAGELADRVRGALARLGGDEPRDELPTVSTYHAYAAGIVRDHALRIGREPLTALLSEAARWQLAARVVTAARGPFSHLPWTVPWVARYLLALDAELSEHRRTPAEVLAYDAALIAEIEALPKPPQAVREVAETARQRDELLTLVAAYRHAKQDRDLLDYGDQVALAADVAVASAEVCRLERSRYRLVVLDEYQDTGVAQRQLLEALFRGGAVTAVGDPHQAIYGWRGASVGNLLRFGAHFAAAEGVGLPAQPLMTSFRCGGRILEVANTIAAPLRDPTAGRRPSLDMPRLAAPGSAADCGETRVALLATVADEARWVAQQVAAAVHDEAVPPGEVAVLCRAQSGFPRLHAALVDAGLPVEVVGLGGLLEMPEVADVVATLRLLVDPGHNPSVTRLLTGPRWRTGPRDLAALGRFAGRLADSRTPDVADPLARAVERVDPVEVAALLEAVESRHPPGVSVEAVERLRAFAAELSALRPLVGQPVVEVVAEVVARIGLDVEIEAEPEPVAAARAANLAAFADHAAHFTGIDGSSDLPAFLGYLDAAADAENGLDVGGVSGADTVKLLTVHKAKGLEWQVVVVPGLVEGGFPSGQGRPLWTTRAAVLPYPLRGDDVDLPPAPALDKAGLEQFGRDCKAEAAEEERRLGYVACTRAKERLLLAGYWWGETQKKPKGPSTLLQEAAALADRGLVTVDEWVDGDLVGDVNPMHAATSVEVAWPPRAVGERPRRLREAAARVQAARAARGAGNPAAAEPLEPDDALVAAAWRRDATALLGELRRDRAPVLDVMLPRRLTTSQVVALREDPEAFARALARPLPARPDRRARRGTRFHAWVESFYGQRALLEPDELPGVGEELADGELAELRESFLRTPYAARSPVAVEAAFELVVGARMLRGRIDAVYPTEGGYEVVDFKTGDVPRNFEAASLQLSVYRLAWADLAGVDPTAVTAAFLYVRTGTVKRPRVLLSRAELAALLNEDGR